MTSAPSGTLRAAIEAAIDRSYGNRRLPSFAFVRERQVEPALVARIETELGGERVTDWNTDVAERFVLDLGGGASTTVRLSLVGPFAAVTRTEADGSGLVEQFDRPIEQRIAAVLRQGGYTTLPRVILESKTPLQLDSADAAGCTDVFHALFEDTDVLPWRR